jgi:hypothetical protein
MLLGLYRIWVPFCSGTRLLTSRELVKTGRASPTFLLQ